MAQFPNLRVHAAGNTTGAASSGQQQLVGAGESQKTASQTIKTKKWCVIVTYALGSGEKRNDVKLELRDGNVDDYKVFMVLLCRALPDYIRIKEVPVVWKFVITVCKVERKEV